MKQNNNLWECISGWISSLIHYKEPHKTLKLVAIGFDDSPRRLLCLTQTTNGYAWVITRANNKFTLKHINVNAIFNNQIYTVHQDDLDNQKKMTTLARSIAIDLKVYAVSLKRKVVKTKRRAKVVVQTCGRAQNPHFTALSERLVVKDIKHHAETALQAIFVEIGMTAIVTIASHGENHNNRYYTIRCTVPNGDEHYVGYNGKKFFLSKTKIVIDTPGFGGKSPLSIATSLLKELFPPTPYLGIHLTWNVKENALVATVPQ